MDLTQFVAAGGIVGLFSASAIVLFKSMSYEATITKRFQEQIDDLTAEVAIVKEENAKCTKTNHILIMTLQKHNIEVPPEGWL